MLHQGPRRREKQIGYADGHGEREQDLRGWWERALYRPRERRVYGTGQQGNDDDGKKRDKQGPEMYTHLKPRCEAAQIICVCVTEEKRGREEKRAGAPAGRCSAEDREERPSGPRACFSSR